MTATVRPGIYLEDNPPTRPQFRLGRRAQVKPVIVVHTAESGTDLEGVDPKAENVANFIRTRDTAGSYHLLGDADSIIQLVRFEHEAFHDGTGSNRWSIGISLAMNAEDWPTLDDGRRDQFIDTAVQMAVIAATWLAYQNAGYPMPTMLTRTQSERPGASGFIAHGGPYGRDSDNRTDPGDGFPWDDFLSRYAVAVNHEIRAENLTPLEQWQNDLLGRGHSIGSDDGQPDNDFGPATLRASRAVLQRLDAYKTSLDEALTEIEKLNEALAAAGVDPDVARKAALLDLALAQFREFVNVARPVLDKT